MDLAMDLAAGDLRRAATQGHRLEEGAPRHRLGT
jgi:hypothetical protein